MIEFFLPLPPTVNSMYSGGSGQRRFKTKKYKEWCAQAEVLCKAVRKVQEYPVRLEIGIVWPDNRACDLSNRIKAIEDILVNTGILKDDDRKHIAALAVFDGGVDRARAGAYVRIEYENIDKRFLISSNE